MADDDDLVELTDFRNLRISSYVILESTQSPTLDSPDPANQGEAGLIRLVPVSDQPRADKAENDVEGEEGEEEQGDGGATLITFSTYGKDGTDVSYTLPRATFLQHSSVADDCVTAACQMFAGDDEGPRVLGECVELLRGGAVPIDVVRFPYFLKFSLLLKITRLHNVLLKWTAAHTTVHPSAGGVSFLQLWKWSKLALICNPKAVPLRKQCRTLFNRSALHLDEGELVEAAFSDLELLRFLLGPQFIWWTISMLVGGLTSLARASNVLSVLLSEQTALMPVLGHCDHFVSVFLPALTDQLGDHALSVPLFRFQLALVEYQRHRLLPTTWPACVGPHPQRDRSRFLRPELMLQLRMFYRPVVWLEMLLQWLAVLDNRRHFHARASLGDIETRMLSIGYYNDIIHAILNATSQRVSVRVEAFGNFLERSFRLSSHDREVLGQGWPLEFGEQDAGSSKPLILHLTSGTPCYYPQPDGTPCHWWLRLEGQFASFYTNDFVEITEWLKRSGEAYVSCFYQS